MNKHCCGKEVCQCHPKPNDWEFGDEDCDHCPYVDQCRGERVDDCPHPGTRRQLKYLRSFVKRGKP